MSVAATSTKSTKAEPKPDMAERIAQEQASNEFAHEWVAAAEVAIDNATARRASFRGSFRAEDGMRVDALETYCRKCKRPLDEVYDEKCSWKVDNSHLIGGTPGERAKRKVHEPVGKVIKTGVIDRRGMSGYSVHAGR